MTKVGMVSLGCPKNLVDSEVMLGMLARQGYELTPQAEQAEVIIVNTCAFIDPAKRESIDTILEMAEFKKSGSARRLVVAGCLVERYRQEILKEIPEVDFVIGTNELERVLEACGEESKDRSLAAVAEPYLYHELTPRVLATPSYSAYLKIAEGCDHPCSFCVIPQMRGRFRSRRFASVVREAENLARKGAAELTIVGPGHHELRRGPGAAGRLGVSSARTRENPGTRLGAISLLLSESPDRRADRRRGRNAQGGEVH